MRCVVVGGTARARQACVGVVVVSARPAPPTFAPFRRRRTARPRNATTTYRATGNAEANELNDYLKEIAALCLSAFVLTMTVAADSLSDTADGAAEVVARVENVAQTNASSNAASNAASNASNQWYARNPFVKVSGEGQDGAPALAAESTAWAADGTFSDGIKWLNQVTLSITDELDAIHPPPLKNLVAQATDSDIVREFQDVGKVFGSVASDLKEGFLELEGTIESISRGEESGIHLPAKDGGEGGEGAAVNTANAADGTLASKSTAATAPTASSAPSSSASSSAPSSSAPSSSLPASPPAPTPDPADDF